MSGPDGAPRRRFARTSMVFSVLFASALALETAAMSTAAVPAQADSSSRAVIDPDSSSSEEVYCDPSVRELAERLGLTDEQAGEIASILGERERRKLELEKKYGGGDETDRLSLVIEERRLDNEIEERIAFVLDEAQMKAYAEYRSEKQSQERKERVDAYVSGDPHFEELVSRLSLTDAQAAEVYPILEEHGRRMRELMEGVRGQGKQELSAMRDRLGELDSSTENRLSRILDERQMSEYRRYVEEQRSRMRGARK